MHAVQVFYDWPSLWSSYRHKNLYNLFLLKNVNTIIK